MIFLVLLFITIPTHTQICSLFVNPNDLLQSGSHMIFNSRTNSPLNREHTFTFGVNFRVPPGGLQVAACKH